MSPVPILRSSLPRLIESLSLTGFHNWGFVIYRETYGDDAIWERYMDYFKSQVHLMLKHLEED